MARASADKSIPPPLRALGGWPDADWFDPAILDQSEVVGITLPPLPGSRKQSFELAERATVQPMPAKARAPKPSAAPARVPAGIDQVLDATTVTRAAAFRRPRFFFDAAPTLFFAEIPLAHLKARAADKLRRDLIQIAFRGCVLTCGPKSITGMFWPAQEVDLTNFVRAAAPPHALHPHFDVAEEEARLAGPSRGQPAKGASGRAASAPRDSERRAERERLLAELDGLRAKVVELERLHSVAGAMKTLGLDDDRLRAMLLLLHPDKHANSAAANEAAKWVNGLRDVLKENRKS